MDMVEISLKTAAGKPQRKRDSRRPNVTGTPPGNVAERLCYQDIGWDRGCNRKAGGVPQTAGAGVVPGTSGGHHDRCTRTDPTPVLLRERPS